MSVIIQSLRGGRAGRTAGPSELGLQEPCKSGTKGMSVVWLRWLKCGLPIGVLFVIGQGLIWFGIVGLAIGAVAWLTGFGDFWGDPGAPQGPIKKWGAWVILIGALLFGARKGCGTRDSGAHGGGHLARPR